MITKIAPRIVIDPSVKSGRPAIEGTRIPVDVILGHLAAGMTAEEVATEFGITLDDVHAVLEYAASVLASEEIRLSN